MPQSSANNHNTEPSQKRQRTVKILEDKDNDQGDQEIDRNEEKEATFRRTGIMKFKMQSTWQSSGSTKIHRRDKKSNLNLNNIKLTNPSMLIVDTVADQCTCGGNT